SGRNAVEPGTASTGCSLGAWSFAGLCYPSCAIILIPSRQAASRPSKVVCASCQQARGYIYEAFVYGPSELRDKLCPWCIADGKAASRFNGFFSVEDPVVEAGIPRGLVPPPANILELFICGPDLLPVPCTGGPPMRAVRLNGWKEKRCQNLPAPRPACMSSS